MDRIPEVDTVALLEAFIYKVNFKGKKRKKLDCPGGYEPNESGTGCKPMTAQHKQHLKVGARMGKRTKKSLGVAFIKRTVKKMKRAKKFRAAMGLK